MKKIRRSRQLYKLVSLYKLSIKAGLANPDDANWQKASRRGASLRDFAASAKACKYADYLWFLHVYCEAMTYYITAFQKIKNKRYYDAWCLLERAEIAFDSLKLNQFVPGLEQSVTHLSETIVDWQSLYPYKIFISPELLIKKEKCSICGFPTGPWSKCIHVVKRVYCGKQCIRIITSAEFLGASLVTDPVQKYSVVRIAHEDGTDQFSYTAVEWVAERLESPFDGWSVEHTKRLRPHADFKNILPEDDCPCGTMRSYSSCCLKRDGVVSPHLNVWLEKHPTSDLALFKQY